MVPFTNQSVANVICSCVQNNKKVVENILGTGNIIYCHLRFGISQVSYSDTSKEITRIWQNICYTGIISYRDMNSFNSCEKIISESDALQTLDESLVLAAGSSNVFTKVKTTTDVKEYMNDSYWYFKDFIFSHT